MSCVGVPGLSGVQACPHNKTALAVEIVQGSAYLRKFLAEAMTRQGFLDPLYMSLPFTRNVAGN